MKRVLVQLLGLWAVIFMLVPTPAQSQSDKPNVLFIAVDDLRPTLGAFGDDIAITPHIDGLADQSVIFDRHYVQQASCAPSRTSMLTGYRPEEIEVTNHNTHFRDTRPEVVTLPQRFKQEGYKTVGIGKIFHYRAGFQDDKSWSVELYETNHGLKKTQYVLPDNRTGGKATATESANVRDDAYLDGKYTDLATDFLRKFKAGEDPFFLAVGFLKPHLPFSAPSRYWDLYERDDFKKDHFKNKPDNAPELAFHDNNELRGYEDIPNKGNIPGETRMKLRHGYYACVSYVDAQVGQILKVLDELNLRDDTIIVFWGDHGFHLGEQTIWAKSTTYELDAHSPLMIAAPGVAQKGQHSKALVESLDIYPTLVDLAGIEPAEPLSGKSLRPLLENPDEEWDGVAYNQFPRPYKAAIGGRVPKSHMGYSVRTDEWRYTAWYNYETGSFQYPELYFMKEQGVETDNLAGKDVYADVQKKLHDLIKKYADK